VGWDVTWKGNVCFFIFVLIFKGVFLGSVPPWLRSDEMSMFPELMKALIEVAQEKKKKNPKRVGAGKRRERNKRV
jgi:hypothetical protein